MGLVNIVLFALFATALAQVVKYTPCDNYNAEVCTVSDVRITPCPSGQNCPLKKGSDVTISFDFTPQFATSNLKTMVYWDNGAMDLEFAGFGSKDACIYSTCPTESGRAQTLNYNLHLSKKLPKGKYLLKWKVWDDDDTEHLCCFKTPIRLIN